MYTSLPLFLTNTTAEDDQAITPKMLYLSRQGNELRELVENERWERSTLWEVIDAVDVATDFPFLTEELRNATLGTYQVKMPKDEYEHLQEDGAYDILNTLKVACFGQNISVLDTPLLRIYCILILQIQG